MNFQIRMVIFKKKYIYDDIIINSEEVCKLREDCLKTQPKFYASGVSDSIQQKCCPILLNDKGFTANLVSAYVYTMIHSNMYRKLALYKLKEFVEVQINVENPVILVRLVNPKHQFLDYGW